MTTNAAMIAELQAVALAVRMFGLDGLRAGNVTLAGSRHPVAADGEGSAREAGAMPTEPLDFPTSGEGGE